MPTLTLATFGPEPAGPWYGNFQGFSDGYAFKVAAKSAIAAEVQTMLETDDDLSIRTITSGAGSWYVHGENRPYKPKKREFLMFDQASGGFDAMMDALTERLGEGRALRACHFSEPDETWALYFEGDAVGKVSITTADDNDELVSKINDKADQEVALRSMTFGEGTWLLYFEGELAGDCSWYLNSDYSTFTNEVASKFDDDQMQRVCVYGNGVWFAYWEGAVPETDDCSWAALPELTDFVTHVEKQWDDDDDDGDDGKASTSKSPLKVGTMKRPRKIKSKDEAAAAAASGGKGGGAAEQSEGLATASKASAKQTAAEKKKAAADAKLAAKIQAEEAKKQEKERAANEKEAKKKAAAAEKEAKKQAAADAAAAKKAQAAAAKDAKKKAADEAKAAKKAKK